jgi:hypothetical protein
MLKFLRSFPLPLVLAFVAAIVARGALAVGGDPLDPAWTAITTLAVGLVAGLFTTDSPLAALRALDPKLVSFALGAGLTYLAVEVFGFAADDPLAQATIALIVGSVIGWGWPNAATIARTNHEVGNAIDPNLARPSQLP